jgi:DNA-binding IscR family transcriptional regulator
MLIPQTAEYALRAVLHLARHDARPVRVPEMADAIAVPRNYLSKTAITRSSVSAVFAGTPERKCLLANRPCGRDPGCPVHARWAPVAERLAVFFGTTTVADLVGGASSPVGGRAEAVPADVPALLLPATRRETP